MPFTTFFPRGKIRGYLHSNGSAFRQPNDVVDYLTEIEDRYAFELQEFDYLFAALWGADERMADMYGYSDIGAWPGNATRSSWVLKNGIYCPPTGPTCKGAESGCEDTDILMGAEGLLRRSCKSLDEYLASENPLNLSVYR